ncbi:MAG: peptidase C11 [Oscillospiraceae bacterium]|nr:peptidase C11 [Oscillospiraceae bacterium]
MEDKPKRPRGREKNVTGEGKKVYKRGEGLNTGPVGKADGYQGRRDDASAPEEEREYSSGGTRSLFGGRGRLIIIILILVLLLGGGGSCLGSGGSLFGLGSNTGSTTPSGNSSSYNYNGNSSNNGSSYSNNSGSTANNGYNSNSGNSESSYNNNSGSSYSNNSGNSSSYSNNGGSAYGGMDLSSLFGGYGNTSTGWTYPSNVGVLNTRVASGARAKRTNILGNNQDTVTIMVYMCGTDLESRSSMGTADLSEMANATLSSNVNVIVYTGGCRRWNNQLVSSSVNQVYKIEGGGRLSCVVQNAGTDSMVNPNTLAGFIQFCAKNYPANRNELIFWDHGGGSISGYGYDEKYASAGSMTLKGINDALKTGGVTFDFIGFDACLMATMENALMLTDYADYMIASEETEPGVGWYYTNWLTKLSANTSMSTLEIGQNIVDDFVSVCNQKCPGQKTTLSVVDLAELEVTAPAVFNRFSTGTSQLIQGNSFKTVSTARSKAREFAASTKIDQVDLVNLAYNLGTNEGKQLAETLLSAVKYNRTSSSITDAYGLSIYFPYQRTSQVNSAISTYNAIGIDSEYSRVIQQFASMGYAGQSAATSYGSGSVGSPLSSLLGGLTGMTGSSSASAASTDMISEMLSGLMGGGSGFFGRSLDADTMADYISENRFDAGSLVWLPSGGSYALNLSEDQWSLVNDVELNVFLDDGEGFIDLGLDNVYDFTDDGQLKGEYDGTWLAIDGQPVAYYHTGTVDDGENYTITGRVPVMINGERADLLLMFDNENPYGYIAGAVYTYDESETETVGKAVTELQDGDKIDFLCDYYSYSGEYQNSYYLGDPYVYRTDAEISNVTIDAEAALATYRFTDIYCQEYWTAPIP